MKNFSLSIHVALGETLGCILLVGDTDGWTDGTDEGDDSASHTPQLCGHFADMLIFIYTELQNPSRSI